MPRSNSSAILDLMGLDGKDVVVSRRDGKLVLSKFKKRRKSKSPKRKETNDKLRDANRWAKRILAQPEMKALYEKGINAKKTSAHTVAVADYLNAPNIEYVKLGDYKGACGDPIRIKATDDFQVVSVEVKITDGKGELLEEGKAERYSRKHFMWVYKAAETNAHLTNTTIRVIAKDRPGNKKEERCNK